MGQAGHRPAERPVGHLVVEGRFRGGHGVVEPSVGEIGDRLDGQLVGAGHQLLERDAGLVGHELRGIFGVEVPPDGLHGRAGAAAPAADDARQRCARPGAGIGVGIQGQGSASAVLELAYFPEMQDVP